MILELDGGRELKLPDDMPDETARQLKRLILTLEERARTAESEVRLLRDEMEAVRKLHAATQQDVATDQETASAIRDLKATMAQGLERVERAVLVDRKLVADKDGEMAISRAVTTGGNDNGCGNLDIH